MPPTRGRSHPWRNVKLASSRETGEIKSLLTGGKWWVEASAIPPEGRWVQENSRWTNSLEISAGWAGSKTNGHSPSGIIPA